MEIKGLRVASFRERPLGALPLPLVTAEPQHLPIEILLRGHTFGGEGAETIDIFLGSHHFLCQGADFGLLDLDLQLILTEAVPVQY